MNWIKKKKKSQWHKRKVGRAHQSILGVDGSEGTVLVQVRGVPHHGRVTRLSHWPSRAPWIWGLVGAFCQGAPSVFEWHQEEEEENKGRQSTWEASHIMTSLGLHSRDILGGWIHNFASSDCYVCRKQFTTFNKDFLRHAKPFNSTQWRPGGYEGCRFGRTDLACRMAVGRHFLLWRLGNPHCPGWSFPRRQVHRPA